MNNLLSYCGLVDANLRASDKDLPVPQIKLHPNSGHYTLMNYLGQKLNAELIKSAAKAKV